MWRIGLVASLLAGVAAQAQAKPTELEGEWQVVALESVRELVRPHNGTVGSASAS